MQPLGAPRRFLHEAGRLLDAAGNVDFPLLWSKIQHLERRELDGIAAPPRPLLTPLLDSLTLVRVTALGRFWLDDQGNPLTRLNFPRYTIDLLAALHGMQTELVFLLLGNGREIGIFFGCPNQPTMPPATSAATLSAALKGIFPGIELDPAPAPGLIGVGRNLLAGGAIGMLVGPPAGDSSADNQAARGEDDRLERSLRGMEHESWAYLVLARPLTEAVAAQGVWDTINELTVVSPAIRVQDTVSRDQRVETIRREAQYYSTALETLVRRLQAGRNQGLWQVVSYVAGQNEWTLHKALGLLRAGLSGDSAAIEPLRSFVCRQGAPSGPANAADLSSVLTSAELAVMVQLPRQEVQGYAVREYARFDLDVAPLAGPPGAALELGIVQNGKQDTGQVFGIPLNDLSKHALVCGVTGSGKTTTCFHILNSVWNAGRGVPFLVIEPAKTEYRRLLNAAALATQLRIYTLGDDRWAGFRLNPFEFEWRADGSGVHVQSHIDYLRSLFNASFVLYAPMPYVLEVALHGVYEDCGWDLAGSRNVRLPEQAAKDPALLSRLQSFLFPTLSDLYDKIEAVVTALGYDDRVRMDVQAGLKARIHSLRVGGKGLMLDTRKCVDIGALLRQPTLLELQAVGDDEEKAFIIGLLLTRIYEYRHVESGQQPRTGLTHITLIEEAHRLLANVPPGGGSESANVKGKSVQTFTNMLAEIRAYGEGVLIAEQIPAQLAPDAIKNTNLKLLHRTVSLDDREVVGATMNFTPAQTRFVSTLPSGYAAGYAEGADQAYLIRVPDPYGSFLPAQPGGVDNERVRNTMRQRSLFQGQQFSWCAGQCALQPGGAACDAGSRTGALAGPLRAQLAVYLSSGGENPTHFALGYDDLAVAAEVALDRADLMPAARRILVNCTLLAGLSWLLEERGRQYRWGYDLLEAQQTRLVEIVRTIATERGQGIPPAALVGKLAGPTTSFSAAYRAACLRGGPFHDCASCRHQCRFRYEAARVLRSPLIRRGITEALTGIEDETELWEQLANLVSQAAHAILVAGTRPAFEDAALCYLRQAAARMDLSQRMQARMLTNVRQVLIKRSTFKAP